MARLNDDAQWIVLMGFIVSFSFFFLALVINQSTVVGQTTAESVIEFPKNDIRDIREVIGEVKGDWPQIVKDDIMDDIEVISLHRKSAVVWYDNTLPGTIEIHYNNGVTTYNETWKP